MAPVYKAKRARSPQSVVRSLSPAFAEAVTISGPKYGTLVLTTNKEPSGPPMHRSDRYVDLPVITEDTLKELEEEEDLPSPSVSPPCSPSLSCTSEDISIGVYSPVRVDRMWMVDKERDTYVCSKEYELDGTVVFKPRHGACTLGYKFWVNGYDGTVYNSCLDSQMAGIYKNASKSAYKWF